MSTGSYIMVILLISQLHPSPYVSLRPNHPPLNAHTKKAYNEISSESPGAPTKYFSWELRTRWFCGVLCFACQAIITKQRNQKTSQKSATLMVIKLQARPMSCILLVSSHSVTVPILAMHLTGRFRCRWSWKPIFKPQNVSLIGWHKLWPFFFFYLCCMWTYVVGFLTITVLIIINFNITVSDFVEALQQMLMFPPFLSLPV